MQHFTLLIQVWYRLNFRQLPWRETKDAYKIWLSEIIMQQTKVDQGIKYYFKIVEKYPTVEHLAKANEQEVLRIWQGLGYYSRARNLHKAAQQIVEDFNGTFPNNYNAIISLKGVGTYTAAAISSFAFDLPYPVLDGNAFRVLARYFNDATPIDTGKGKKVFSSYAESVLNKDEPAEFNQAIMELGALICKPKNPDCLNCPLKETCLAFNEGDPLTLPVKSKKVKVVKRFFHYFVFSGNTIQLEKRDTQGIWKNMYQFPLIEVDKKVQKKELEQMVYTQFGVHLGNKILTKEHKLTHQNIYATFWLIQEKIQNTNYISTDLNSIDQYPLPRLIDWFIENNTKIFL